jgi:hypothetical protein
LQRVGVKPIINIDLHSMFRWSQPTGPLHLRLHQMCSIEIRLQNQYSLSKWSMSLNNLTFGTHFRSFIEKWGDTGDRSGWSCTSHGRSQGASGWSQRWASSTASPCLYRALMELWWEK